MYLLGPLNLFVLSIINIHKFEHNILAFLNTLNLCVYMSYIALLMFILMLIFKSES